MDNKKNDYINLDWGHIISFILSKIWIVILTAVVAASSAFVYAAYFVKPKYSASVMLYVNNSSVSLGHTNYGISLSEISAAQSLVKTYIVILENKTTLEQVVNNTDLGYTYGQLAGMISASQVNDTEVFKITVTSSDPYHSAKLANGIAEVLPDRVADIIDGAAMRYVDMAVVNTTPVSPNVTKYTAYAFIVGVVISTAILFVIKLFDDTIHDDSYIIENFNFPILAKIPDLYDDENTKYYSHRYSYYSSKPHNGGKQ